MSDEILATVSASFPRRIFGVGVMIALGAILVFIALGRGHSSFLWQMFMLFFGVFVLYAAEMMRRATSRTVILTQAGLHDDTGRVIALVDDMANVERGTFAIKPSNGFVVNMKERGAKAWAPGLWWRLGRKVGIGGVTGAGQTKFMSEMLTAMLIERDRAASDQ